MNSHLENIIKLLQDDSLPEGKKQLLLKAITDADKQWAITDFKLDRTEKVKKTTAILLEETIEELEQKRKAVEGQNKELEIEAALEKVRSRSLAMHNSNELKDVVRVVFEKLKELNFGIDGGAFIATPIENSKDINAWVGDDHAEYPSCFRTPFSDNPMMLDIWNARESGMDFFSKSYFTEEKNQWFRHAFENTDYRTLPGELKNWILQQESLTQSFALAKNSAIGIHFHHKRILSDNEVEILKRFSHVFEQGYIRFLDLQKAEAQSRESQIQLALERVRARTMAMQKSDELPDAALLLSTQVKELGVQLWSTSFQPWDNDRKAVTAWTALRDIMLEPFKIPATEDSLMINISDAAKKGELLYVEEMGGKVLESHLKYMNSLPGVKEEFGKVVAAGFSFPTFNIFHAAYFSTGFILFITEKPCPEAHDIFKRFAAVFEQTYTRFLDLKKAEEQAREAKVEASLERTRTQSMLMQHSKELDDSLQVFHEQVLLLGIHSAFSFLWLPDEKNDRHIFWAAWAENNNSSTVFKSKAINYPLDRNEPATAQCLIDWKSNNAVVSYYVSPAGVEAYFAAWQELIDGVEQLKPEYFSGGLYYVEAFMKYGCFGVMAATDLMDDEKKILERFSIEFERTYTRFLDLQKAEAQAREAQIEAALEKVRSRSLAMHKAEELGEVVTVVVEKMRELNIPVNDGVAIVTPIEGSKDQIEWWENPGFPAAIKFYQPYYEHPILADYWKAKSEGIDFIAPKYTAEENRAFLHHIFEHTDYKHTPQEVKDYCLAAKSYAYSAFFQKNSSIFINDYSERSLTEQEIDIVKRFSKVFEQAYTRFLDLQKAEAQAREAQIEAALERVRAKAMAMHKSDDLHDAVAIVFQELDKLNLGVLRVGISVLNKEKRTGDVWLTSVDKDKAVQVHGNESFDFHPLMQGSMDAWIRQEDFYYILEGEDLTNYYKAIEDAQFGLPASQMLSSSQENKKQSLYVAVYNAGGLFAFREGEFPPEAKTVMKRFAGVFDLTYKRFLDLQKAEAQARESQIQLALERVRARTMAMQHSDELSETAVLLFHQLMSLELNVKGCGFNIWEKDEKTCTSWMSGPGGELSPPFQLPLTVDPLFIRYYESRQNGEDFWVYETGKQELANRYAHLLTLPVLGDAITRELEAGKEIPGFVVDHVVNFSQGNLIFITYERCPEAWDIFKRFGKIFEQTYTRFLDLKKAEEQARESQIEAALERVRSRSMGMQKSDELRDVIQVIFEQLIHLNFNIDGAGFGVDFRETDDWNLWVADRYLPYPNKISIPYFDHPYSNAIIEAKNNGVELLVYSLTFEEKNKMWDHVFKYAPAPQEAKESVYSSPGFAVTDVLMKNVELFMENYAGIPYTEAENATLMRFGKVFEQTYTRFNDLKNAEAQALEAIKRASVDRVRAEIASMRTTKDLERIQPLIWNELTTLSVPFIRCGVFIMDEEQQLVHTFLSTPEGKAIATMHVPFRFDLPIITNGVNHWRKKEIYKEYWDAAAFTRSWIALSSLSETQGGSHQQEQPPENLYLHLLPFLQGMLYVGNSAPLNEVELQLVQNLADAFATAYARYEDFNKLEAAKKQVDSTLNELQATQKQLIQSEKMASLGELTAGIAHEIQNPLNFVNNFSDVNTELIEELKKELKDGNAEEVIAIANDIKANEEKINHHGRRADAIVKGMLQHSRSTGNVKEPADINVLADEYLRLAYHGLRAKDKSFNAMLKTDYDETIGKINIIPQDIGRVILNIITNAFYTVNEKKKIQGDSYEPTVSLITKKIGDGIDIKVSDNGNGIPKTIIDKIFQPFFTTKPTGQGTGLGLSLAYDIVKAHGGELKVESKQAEGTEFIIYLPLS